jgi:hypothetical protein
MVIPVLIDMAIATDNGLRNDIKFPGYLEKCMQKISLCWKLNFIYTLLRQLNLPHIANMEKFPSLDFVAALDTTTE